MFRKIYFFCVQTSLCMISVVKILFLDFIRKDWICEIFEEGLLCITWKYSTFTHCNQGSTILNESYVINLPMISWKWQPSMIFLPLTNVCPINWQMVIFYLICYFCLILIYIITSFITQPHRSLKCFNHLFRQAVWISLFSEVHQHTHLKYWSYITHKDNCFRTILSTHVRDLWIILLHWCTCIVMRTAAVCKSHSDCSCWRIN